MMGLIRPVTMLGSIDSAAAEANGSDKGRIVIVEGD
jgi:hypothetical protein